MNRLLKNILWIGIPFGIYLLYSSFLKTWIIDDAGISFAYARNLASGYGLTSWPGEKPVEGFSNFLWTIFIALLHLFKLFDPIITPKIMAAIFMAGSMLTIQQIFFKISKNQLTGLAANLFIAANAPLVIWFNSGLENSLYVFLLLLFLKTIIQAYLNPIHRNMFWFSMVCLLISITRPEGLIYSLAIPLVWLLTFKQSRKQARQVLWFGIYFLILFGGFLCFRYFYFGDFLPNTYYVKYGPAYTEGSFLNKIEYLTYALGGRWARYLIILICLAIPFSWKYAGDQKTILKIFLIFFLLGILNFFILPSDWMGELRFASPFIIFSYTLLVFQFYIFFKAFADKSDAKKIISTGVLSLLIIYSGYHFYNRTKEYSNHPTVSFNTIRTIFAENFNTYAERLQLKNASILLPDIGATLYYSKLHVYDAAGLCDKTIAKNIGKNNSALLDYVFDVIKPTFIHLHLKWESLYSIKYDSRFRRDYVRLYTEDPVRMNESIYPLITNNYLRKDALNEGNKSTFDSLFAAHY